MSGVGGVGGCGEAEFGTGRGIGEGGRLHGWCMERREKEAGDEGKGIKWNERSNEFHRGRL